MGGASKRARGTEFARRETTFSHIEVLLRDPYAESGVISLIADGCSKNDIIRRLHEVISKRIFTMAGKLRMEKPITTTGGVAKNQGIVDALRRLLSTEIHVPEEPQIVGAVGAALSA
jgi:activator of 2-hydroxyglutaryl-CoA dehydratase